ncbi:nucleoporin protein [Corchorus olitorius]|uniref:Nucleoporin protein n=1 Tax=Corchorus olitorius TaxID=93759 RepID=A0A1R3JDD4_9ROSI|nr:nucleoporin protein [Corchorus olitorius]
MASHSSIVNVGWNGLSSGSWLLSGKLAKMLLIDSEQNDYDCPLTISVLDFTMQLVRTGVEDDIVVSLIVFSLQYILVNHEYWKYKVKNTRWKVTLKDTSSSIPAFHQAMLSSMTKPIPVVAAVISLISFFRDPAIQVGAAKLLSMLLQMAEPHPFANLCFGPDDKQPAFLVAIFDNKEDAGGAKQSTDEALSGSLGSKTSSVIDALLQYVERSDDVINR